MSMSSDDGLLQALSNKFEKASGDASARSVRACEAEEEDGQLAAALAVTSIQEAFARFVLRGERAPQPIEAVPSSAHHHDFSAHVAARVQESALDGEVQRVAPGTAGSASGSASHVGALARAFHSRAGPGVWQYRPVSGSPCTAPMTLPLP